MHIALRFVFAAFSLLSAHAEDLLPIRIGAIYGLTGPASSWSEQGRRGLELALEEVNQAGGVNGRKLEIIFEDSQSQAMPAVSAYRNLVHSRGIKLLLGAVWDTMTVPLLPLAKRDDVLIVSTVMNQTILNPNDHFFSTGPRIESLYGPVKRFFVLNPDVKTIAILCWEGTWGWGYRDLWKKVAAEQGVKVVYEACHADFNSTYQTEATAIAAKKVDVVVMSYLFERLLTRLHALGAKPKMLTTSDMVEALRSRKVSSELAEGIYFTDWPVAPEFIERYQHKYGSSPFLEAHNHYEALQALARALAKNTNKPIEALRQVKYSGAGGPLDFSTGPFANKQDGRLFRVQAGKFESLPE